MRLREEFVIHETGAETILVPTGTAGFSGVVRGNAALGAMLRLLYKETSEAHMVEELHALYQAPDGAIERDVSHLLAELRRIGAIDE